MFEISNILLLSASLGAAFYCFVLGRRLKKFGDLEKGVGGAVAVLSAQVDELKGALATAQKSADASATTLTELSDRAEALSNRLELHLAALQDIPDASPPRQDAEEEAMSVPGCNGRSHRFAA